MSRVGVRQLKDRLSECLRRVARGERITVTDRGRPVAVLGPATESPEISAAQQLVREGVVRLLHSPATAVHLVTLLEDLPVTETLETVTELLEADLRVGALIVNRARARYLGARSVAAAVNGRVDTERVRAGLTEAGLDLSADALDGLVAETVEHAVRVDAEAAAMQRLTAEPAEALPVSNVSRAFKESSCVLEFIAGGQR